MTEAAAVAKKTLSAKEWAISVISEMPDDVTLEEISDEMKLLVALQVSIAQADAGQTIPHEEVKRRMKAWITK